MKHTKQSVAAGVAASLVRDFPQFKSEESNLAKALIKYAGPWIASEVERRNSQGIDHDTMDESAPEDLALTGDAVRDAKNLESYIEN